MIGDGLMTASLNRITLFASPQSQVLKVLSLCPVLRALTRHGERMTSDEKKMMETAKNLAIILKWSSVWQTTAIMVGKICSKNNPNEWMSGIVSNDAFRFYTRNEKVGEVSKCGKVRVTSKTLVRSDAEKKERKKEWEWKEEKDLMWRWVGEGVEIDDETGTNYSNEWIHWKQIER